MLRITILIVLSSISVGAQSSQPPAQLLEVISVKPLPLNQGARGRTWLALPGGRFTARSVPLGLLLNTAYDYPSERMVGAPKWLDTQMFDIDARGSWDALPPPDVVRRMVRQVLVERFRLKVHTEQRPTEVYALVLANRDGKLGAGLRLANNECAERAAAKKEFPPPRFPEPGQRHECGMASRMNGGVRQLRLGSMRISTLLSLTNPRSVVGRLVVDRTGLQGPFDIALDYVPDTTSAPAARSEQVNATPEPTGPSLLTALREQLGLRLEQRKEPVDVLVIDHVEMPTPN